MRSHSDSFTKETQKLTSVILCQRHLGCLSLWYQEHLHFGSCSWLISILFLCQAESWSINSSKAALTKAALADSLTNNPSRLSKPCKDPCCNGSRQRFEEVIVNYIGMYLPQKEWKFKGKEKEISLGWDLMYESKHKESGEGDLFTHVLHTKSVG